MTGVSLRLKKGFISYADDGRRAVLRDGSGAILAGGTIGSLATLAKDLLNLGGDSEGFRLGMKALSIIGEDVSDED